MGSVGTQVSKSRFELDVKNSFSEGEEIEYVGPDVARIPDNGYHLFDADGKPMGQVTHHAGEAHLRACRPS